MINTHYTKRSSCRGMAEITQSKRKISAGNGKCTDMHGEMHPSLAYLSYTQLPRFIDQNAL